MRGQINFSVILVFDLIELFMLRYICYCNIVESGVKHHSHNLINKLYPLQPNEYSQICMWSPLSSSHLY